jgi:hypothetical protein
MARRFFPRSLAFACLFALPAWGLADTPPFSWWYEPYAAPQPAWSAEGELSLDLTGAVGKSVAIFRLKLAETGLKPGEKYTLSFEAKAEPGRGAVLQLPMPSQKGERDDQGRPKPESKWTGLSPQWRKVTATFTYDPAVLEGSAGLLWPPAQLKAPGIVSLRHVKITPGEPAAKPKPKPKPKSEE